MATWPTDEVGECSPSQGRFVRKPRPSGALDVASESEARMTRTVRICGTDSCYLQFLAVPELLKTVACERRSLSSGLPQSWVRMSDSTAAVCKSAFKDRKWELPSAECEQGGRNYELQDRTESAKREGCRFDMTSRGFHVTKRPRWRSSVH